MFFQGIWKHKDRKLFEQKIGSEFLTLKKLQLEEIGTTGKISDKKLDKPEIIPFTEFINILEQNKFNNNIIYEIRKEIFVRKLN